MNPKDVRGHPAEFGHEKIVVPVCILPEVMMAHSSQKQNDSLK
jgi:hypothetical protein